MEQEIKLLLAKAEDTVRLSEVRNVPKFLGFLTPTEASSVLKHIGTGKALLFGGYDGAERNMLGIIPQYIEQPFSVFPITPIGIYYREQDTLSHRDVLGAFMSQGIKRSLIGDILFAKGFAVAFVANEIVDYLITQVTKIKNVGVRLKTIEDERELILVSSPKTQPLSITVSSPRLDAVVSGLAGLGRGKAEELIKNGLVFVNSFEVLKGTVKVTTQDVITIRGVGRFVIREMGCFSKKGREIIKAEKYV